jgi:hypothetical protein
VLTPSTPFEYLQVNFAYFRVVSRVLSRRFARTFPSFRIVKFRVSAGHTVLCSGSIPGSSTSERPETLSLAFRFSQQQSHEHHQALFGRARLAGDGDVELCTQGFQVGTGLVG